MKDLPQFSSQSQWWSLRKVVPTFEAVEKIICCDHSNDTPLVVLSRGATVESH